MFDVKDFYPPTKEKLLWEAIRLAKRYIFITNKNIEAIFHAKKSLLYYNDEPWVKKRESNFDVTVGVYDRVEVCELIGYLCCHWLVNTLTRIMLGCLEMTVLLF